MAGHGERLWPSAFEEFGGYAGWRVGFAPDGNGGYEWSFFVEGD